MALPSSQSAMVADAAGRLVWNTGLDRGEHLPDIWVCQHRFAQFKYRRFFRTLAIGEVARDTMID